MNRLSPAVQKLVVKFFIVTVPMVTFKNNTNLEKNETQQRFNETDLIVKILRCKLEEL